MATGPTVWQRRLGSELKRFREAAQMQRDQGAKALEFSANQIWSIEAGRRSIRVIDVERLLDTYGVTDPPQREAILKLARGAREKTWFRAYEDVLSQSYRDYLAIESEADLIRTYHPHVPGLLQTEGYAQAVLALGDHDEDKFEKLTTVRIERHQRVLKRETPAQVHAVMDETVLRRPVGGAKVLGDQLRHLLDLSSLPHVTIQVITDEAVASTFLSNGGFTILRFPEAGEISVVFLESMVGDTFLEAPEEIQTYQVAFDKLAGSALDPSTSAEMIRKAAEELDHRD